MKINTAIVDEYIRSKSCCEIKKHWVFTKIQEDKTLFECPDERLLTKIIVARSQLSKKLTDFQPVNKNVWDLVFGENMSISQNNIAMLIVGAPQPYDAFVVNDKENNKVMVFDLVNILNYPDMINIISGIITHEVAHTLIEEKYSLYEEGLAKSEKLKQMLFDEGFAHYISFPHLAKLHNTYNEYYEKKEHVYNELNRHLERKITEETLIEGNSGSYWSKFISISGLFVVADYVNEGGNLQDLYNFGYNNFYDLFIKYSEQI